MVADRKKELAFSLGGMGSSSTNYYNQAYSRQGWADVAAEVRERWQRGDRDGAAALVTDEMVLATTLIGTEEMVRARLAVWRDAGVNTVRLYPAGDTLDAKLAHPGPGHRAGPASDRERDVGRSGSRSSAVEFVPSGDTFTSSTSGRAGTRRRGTTGTRGCRADSPARSANSGAPSSRGTGRSSRSRRC